MKAKPRFEDIVDAELAVLYRMASQLTRNPSDAEDLVGQTLYRAAKAWDNFDGAYPRSWLIKILRNEHLNVVRKRATKPESTMLPGEEPSDEGFWREIDWQLVGDDILGELKHLPEEYSMTVMLCDVEEMSYEEAATVMDCPIGTVRSRLYRGRNLLRARLVTKLGELAPQ